MVLHSCCNGTVLYHCSTAPTVPVLYCKSSTSTLLQQWMVAIMQYCTAVCQCHVQPTMSCQPNNADADAGNAEHCWAHLKLQLCIGRDDTTCTPAAICQLRGDQQQPAQRAQHTARNKNDARDVLMHGTYSHGTVNALVKCSVFPVLHLSTLSR